MDKERLKVKENEMSYDEILRIKEHAKQYDSIANKKEFLRNAGAYEQKIILLESKRPYEVLNYLSELELETSKKILNSLTQDEIKKILELFTTEDKQNFYENFSELSLVNQFITIDENAQEHVKDLEFDRKVELIDSSNLQTKEASEIVYESMPYNEREEALNQITNANAAIALSTVDTHYNDEKMSEMIENNNINVENIKAETPQELEQKIENEILKETKEQNNKLEDNINKFKTEFLKASLQNYVKTIPKFASLINDLNLTYEMLPEDLKSVVDKDFELKKEQEKNELEQQKKNEQQPIVETPKEMINEKNENEEKEEKTELDEFQNLKTECEKQEIEQIKNFLQPQQKEQIKQETQNT